MSNSIYLADEELILKLKRRSFGQQKPSQNVASLLDDSVKKVRATYGSGLSAKGYQYVFVILRVGLQRLLVRKI